MLDGSHKPDVIVAALPFDLIMRVVNEVSETGDEEVDADDAIDFRDLLKAQALHLKKPTQIVCGRPYGTTTREFRARSRRPCAGSKIRRQGLGTC